MAATRGHKVRREGRFFDGRGKKLDGDLVGTVAVANFEGVLLGANHSQLPRGWAGDFGFRPLQLKLVRNRSIRKISADAREIFENICGSMGWKE